MLRRALPLAALALLAAPARAADPLPLVHPLFAHQPDAPENDVERQRFTAAAARYNLRPVEVIDVPAPEPPRAPAEVRVGILNAQKLAFGEALHDLNGAATEVAATGGGGLTTAELSDLYLFRAMATARADWNAPAALPPLPPLASPPSPAAPDARTKAFDDYLRAATLTPARTLNPRELPPQVVADFQRAAALVGKRARGTLVVKGPADAQVSLDGGVLMPMGGGVTFRDLVYGEHLVRVEQIAFAPWGTVVPFGQPSLELDVPARPLLAVDDATAAAHARRMGARFALLALPKGGPGAPLELSLIDANSAVRTDSALVATVGEAGQIDAAVMRLDEEARRIALAEPEATQAPPPTTAPPPPPPPRAIQAEAPPLEPPLLLGHAPTRTRFSDDPLAWSRDHWPVLTAIGVVAATAIGLSAVVASDR